MDKYLKILRDIRAGRDVSKEDLSYFASYHQDFNESTYEKLKAKLGSEEGLKSFSDEDFDTYLNEARKMLTTGKYKEDMFDLAKQAEQGRLAKNVTTGINTLLAGTDIALSGRQIAKSNQLANGVMRPRRPAPLQRDQYLANALQTASNTDPSRALAPAQLAIQDQYQQDLNNARTASAGQAGAYGAYAQTAANRRNRASLDLVPMADQIRRENQAQYNNLIGQHMAENNNIYQSQAQFYPQDMYQYGLDRQMAAELGQMGRYNLRTSLTGLANQLPGPVSQWGARRKYDDIYNRMSTYGAKNAQIVSDAFKSTDDRANGGPLYPGAPLYEQAWTGY